MKITTILGARPQFIKAAAVSKVFNVDEQIKETIIHTGQHYDQNMSDVFFDQMRIPRPDYFLKIQSKLHGQMTGKMLEGIEEILLKDRPDVVLVYGDTNSTLAGALAASKIHIPIAHVEAGLRSFNMRMPEEVNRILTDHISAYLFSPTQTGKKNLIKEGIAPESIHIVGDVMYDAMIYFGKISGSHSTIVKDLNLRENNFILATIHRAENTNDLDKLNGILSALNQVGRETQIVFPIHPRTRQLLGGLDLSNIKVIDPIGYFDMLELQRNCRLIVTDSGGIQKEAYFNKKYCITVREETEWKELVDGGFNFLATNPQDIRALAEQLYNQTFADDAEPLYGEGNAAEKIKQILLTKFQH